DPLIEALDGTVTVTPGADIPAPELLEELPELPEESQDLYDRIAQAFGAESAGERAAAVELALEWLFLAQKISKDADDDGTIYG
ncbi:MAG: magnesium chelatase, partial [Micrococcales bacterium]|nr:magnesium chelatase [Micrococcales bacterium]